MNISSPPIAQRAEQKLQNHEVFYAGLVVIVLKLHSWDILQRLSGASTGNEEAHLLTLFPPCFPNGLAHVTDKLPYSLS